MVSISMQRSLVIFAKAPRMGRVKTRLARDIGLVQAWGFFRHALVRLIQRVGYDPRWRTVIAVAPDTAATDDAIWPPDIDRMAQGGGDLGARMQRTFDGMAPGPVVIIGADIPGIRAHHIDQAFRALGNHDAVFGTADDGGYWLVGLKRAPRIPALFDGVRWSSATALADTVANLGDAKIAYLEELIDVDDGRDFARWRQSQ